MRGMRDNWLWEVFESSPVAFNIQDEDGVLVMVNAAYCTLTGRPRADLLGRSPRVFTHPEDILKNILMLEKRYVHPDGTVRWGWVSLSRVMLDMDNFKAYNDTHGHHAGDILLREFATKARGALRPTDLLARWGGEEFALALPHCPSANAATILADLAALVPHSQTFSAGHTTLRPNESVTDCWDRADDLLYAAKRAGRHRALTD